MTSTDYVDAAGPERDPHRRRLPVLLLVPATPPARRRGSSASARPSHPLLAAVGLDLQLPLLPGYPLRELGLDSSSEFVYLAVSFLGLLAMQMVCFVLFPVATPESWRVDQRGRTLVGAVPGARAEPGRPVEQLSEHAHLGRDAHRALPAAPLRARGHTSFRCSSRSRACSREQHYLVDLPAGAALGWLAHRVFAIA